MRAYDGYFGRPFVLPVEGGYVAYGTGSVPGGRVIEVLRSPDLEAWEPTGTGALTRLDEAWATDYWTPEVAHHDGTYFMYCSAGSGDKGHRLRVATAQDPEGPTTGTRTGPALSRRSPAS